MAKSTAVAKVEEENTALVMPEWMKEDAGLGMEGVDDSRSSLPRISIVHPLSKAVEEGKAKAGHFFHSQLEEDLGDSLTIIPVFFESGWTLWEPNGNSAPLARGRRNEKGVWVWDPSNTRFEVINKEGKKEIWDTKGSIAESKLAHWPKGSPPPAAKESLNVLMVLPEIGPEAVGVFSFSKSAFPIGSKFKQSIALRVGRSPVWGVKFKLETTSTTNNKNQKFIVPKLTFAGFNDSKDVYDACKMLHSRVKDTGLYGSMAEESDHGGGDGTVIDSKDF